MGSKQKPIQCGGLIQIWQSPDRSYRHHFLKLDLDCELSNYPGVLIVSHVNHSQVLVANVESLRKELPRLLEQIGDEVIAHWSLEEDDQKRSSILSRLTAHPLFAG